MRLAHSYSSIKLFENCPQRYYRQRIIKDIKDESSDASVYGDRVHKMLEERLKSDAELPQEVERYESLCRAVEKLVAIGGQLHIEKELVLTENLTPTGWWDGDAWLRSKLDVLIIHGTTAVVMDWKTGKRRPDFFQMQMFAAQVFKHYPEVTTVKATLVWLKDMAMDTEIYKREYVNSVWADIMRRIKRIYDALEHDTWPAKPSGLCNYCPAKHDCKFSQK
jgi:RecB family exonuclease